MSDVALVEKLVRELIATGTMWPETVVDLERFVSEAQAGTLSADDRNYLIAFHAKVVLAADAGYVADEPAPQVADDWKERYGEIKRRFALRYDPNNATGASEHVSRADVFTEFWPEFEEVEKS